MTDQISIITADQRPDLESAMDDLASAAWPTFMHKSKVLNQHFMALYESFPQYQIAFIDEQENILAVGNCMPLCWNEKLSNLPDEGVEFGITRAVEDNAFGKKPNTLCAFQIVIADHLRGKRFSSKVVSAMADIGRQNGLTNLIAPVRPNLKCLHPLEPMEDYLLRKRADGQMYDNWIRVHLNMGASIIKVSHRSMYITGTVKEWSEWTGMKFEKSGDYTIDFALVPLRIDLESDFGEYIEPNVWMCHPLS